MGVPAPSSPSGQQPSASAAKASSQSAVPNAVTFIQCGAPQCDHDFQGWREFDDGLGGETVCAKCGIGAMEHTLWLDI